MNVVIKDILEEGADALEATKVIFVGDGAVGKTSVLTRFQTVSMPCIVKRNHISIKSILEH